jgi:MFS transporter, putative metabolite:H+ symporter
VVLERLERQRRLIVTQWKVVSAAILGGTLGSLSVFLDGFALGLFSASHDLSSAQSSSVPLWMAAGIVLGAIFWGWVADRVGRRKAFAGTVLNVSLASGIMAAAPDSGGLMFLTVCFFFAGLGGSGVFVTPIPLV